MLPSQSMGWPYLNQGNEAQQSTLASGQPCETVPIAQVKILQRPRPHESRNQSRISSQHQQIGRPSASSATSSNTAGKPVEPGHQSEQAFRGPTSYYANDDEWPSIADAESKGFGSQKQQRNVLQKPTETIGVHDGNLDQATGQRGTPSSIMHKPTSSVSYPMSNIQATRIPDIGKAPKAPLKTYKERVDEYAKARLRILGSAFSDDDDKGSHDDIAQDHFQRVIHHKS